MKNTEIALALVKASVCKKYNDQDLYKAVLEPMGLWSDVYSSPIEAIYSLLTGEVTFSNTNENMAVMWFYICEQTGFVQTEFNK